MHLSVLVALCTEEHDIREAQKEQRLRQKCKSVSLYLNPLDILHLLTKRVGQTLVICLEH